MMVSQLASILPCALLERPLSAKLNLLVLRCQDLSASKKFYEQLGFQFHKEQHRTGPVHYAAQLEEMVFELYPLKPGAAVDQTRLGFRLSVEGDLKERLDRAGIKICDFTHHPKYSVYVVQDPDGRKVVLS